MMKMKLYKVIVSAVSIIMLAACGNSTDETSGEADEQARNMEESTNTDSKENGTNSTDSEAANENDQEEAAIKEDDSPTNEESSIKEEYLNKLHNTKKEMDEVEPADSSTYALKNVEGNRYDVWDGLLNEVYGVLKGQLPAEEMDQLRQEQRDWIKYRDENAKEASLKYEGGTMEHLEYVAVLANLTEDRCFELVEGYMK
jgi:uncharacterized protein YecT (DUF1311 family)